MDTIPAKYAAFIADARAGRITGLSLSWEMIALKMAEHYPGVKVTEARNYVNRYRVAQGQADGD